MKTFLIILAAIVVAFFYAREIPEAEKGKRPSERKRKFVFSRKKFIRCFVVVIAAAYALNWAYDEGGMRTFLIIVGAIVVAFFYAPEIPEAHKSKPSRERARHAVFSRKRFIGCAVVVITAGLVLDSLIGDDSRPFSTKPPTRSTVTWFPNPKYQKPITETNSGTKSGTKYCLRIFRVIPTPICWTDTD